MSEVQIGLAAALEQFSPRESIRLAKLAEEQGFSGQMAADHFQPWVPQQGEASFVWSVLASLAENTTGDLGPGVTCPSFRLHPAMVAQAAATLEATYPGRTWLGIGSGEALNEHIVGGYWPEAPERVRRMFEALEIIRKLFTGKDVKHSGEFFKLHNTRLWTLPDGPPPPVYIASAGPYTSRKTGELADGLITPGASIDKLAGIVDNFNQGAKKAEQGPGLDAEAAAGAPVVGRGRRDGLGQRPGPVAQRRHEVPEGRRPLAVRLRADGEAGAA